MDNKRDERIAAIFAAAAGLPDGERDQFLQRACGLDQALRAEVESLLAEREARNTSESAVAQKSIPAVAARRELYGTNLSRYRLLEFVGEGGMATVYRAHDEVLQRDIALKVLKAERLHDAPIENDLLREARAVAALEHPNICGVYEIDEDKGKTFIAMPLLDGKTVAELIKDGPLPVEQALDIAIQCARGLEAAHKKGIVHRDVKPGNLMVLDSGVVSIMDFGIAQRGGDSTLTDAGVTVGTVSYMPPEQIDGSHVDHRVDLWALGVVLYEMIEGRVPFEGEDLIATLALINSDSPQPLSIANQFPDLDDTVRRLLEKRPDDRFQDALQVLTELTAQLALLSDPPKPAAWLDRSWIGIVIAILALAIVFLSSMIRPSAPGDAVPIQVPRPLATNLGNETEPALSRDGRRVAYSWSKGSGDAADIYIREVDSGALSRLTDDPLIDHSAAWSPDGERVAFLRCDGGYEHRLFTVSADGGDEREIAALEVADPVQGSAGLSWSPKDEVVAVGAAFANGRGGNIVLVSLADGSTTTIAELLQGRIKGLRDFGPSFSPNGSELAFTRTASPSASETFVVDMSTRELRTYKTLASGSHAWTEDGQALVYRRLTASSASQLWMLHLDSGEMERLPIAASAPVSPTIAGNRLAFTQFRANINLWAFQLPNTNSATLTAGEDGTGRRVISSTRRQHSPDFSPDGDSVVFVSDRRGPLDLWLAEADGTHPRQLTHSVPQYPDPQAGNVRNVRFNAGSPRWSPDGREIVFDGLYGGQTEIFVVSVNGGEPRRLTPDESFNRVPSWSRDGQWIYFSSTRSGRREVWRVGRGGGVPVQMTFAKGHVAEESMDGRTLYYGKGARTPGLWRIRLPAGPEEPLPEFHDIVPRYWRVVSDGVIFLAAEKGVDEAHWELRRFRARTREITVLGRGALAINIGPAGFAVSPDETNLLIPSLDQDDQDVMIVDNFQ